MLARVGACGAVLLRRVQVIAANRPRVRQRTPWYT
jgi:hypothetical protein